MTWRLSSNLFGPDGKLDVNGDEESVNTSAEKYEDFIEAADRADRLAKEYPNAYVDVVDDDENADDAEVLLENQAFAADQASAFGDDDYG